MPFWATKACCDNSQTVGVGFQRGGGAQLAVSRRRVRDTRGYGKRIVCGIFGDSSQHCQGVAAALPYAAVCTVTGSRHWRMPYGGGGRDRHERAAYMSGNAHPVRRPQVDG